MNTLMIDLHGLTTVEYDAEVRRRQNRRLWRKMAESSLVWFCIAVTAELALILFLSKIGGVE